MTKSLRNILEDLFPSLTKKMAVAVVGTSLIAGGTFVFFAQKTGYAMLEQISYTKAHGILEKVQGILSHGYDLTNREEYHRVLKLITQSADVVDAYIVNTDGSITYSARMKNLNDKFSFDDFHQLPNVSDEKYMTQKEDNSYFEYILTGIAPTNPGQGTAEYLILKISIDDLRSIAIAHRTMNIIMTLATFFGLAIIIFLAISLLIIHPIGELHALVKKIEGNVVELESGMKPHFPYLPQTEKKDEIADLFRDFNNLLKHLNHANDKLFEAHQKQLEHADRLSALGEMAASMAHEIKNPIAGVIGALQVFQSETKENDPQREILIEMKTQLERINHAVNDLLSYARPRAPLLEKISINDIIRKTLTLVTPHSVDKKIRISEDLDQNEPNVIGDKKQLQQVLWNIILNGIQAMNNSGTLTIISHRNDANIDIIISDTGPGIPPEHLDNVFKPFFSTKHKGTGLGMTISRNIIEQHHGAITLKNMPGKGVTVTIKIPQFQSMKI
ncbi:MAG: nitrogen regulation protein NR(II) [Bacteroidota bacterium]